MSKYFFIFTDIENSTQLWERYGPAMARALKRHDVLVNETVAARRGRVVKPTGDGVFAVFAAGDARAGAPPPGPTFIALVLATGLNTQVDFSKQ